MAAHREPGEGEHGGQAVALVLRVAIHVFERVMHAVRHRHQLDHAFRRMAGGARALVELRPAAEIGVQMAGDAGDALARPGGGNQAGDGRSREDGKEQTGEGRHDKLHGEK